MNAKKMIRSILMLVLFWYAYLVYLFIDLQMHPIFIGLLTLVMLVMLEVLNSLKTSVLINHKEGEHNEF